jgi:hypothetical protein
MWSFDPFETKNVAQDADIAASSPNEEDAPIEITSISTKQDKYLEPTIATAINTSDADSKESEGKYNHKDEMKFVFLVYLEELSNTCTEKKISPYFFGARHFTRQLIVKLQILNFLFKF